MAHGQALVPLRSLRPHAVNHIFILLGRHVRGGVPLRELEVLEVLLLAEEAGVAVLVQVSPALGGQGVFILI